jgi:hypothetical protein
VFDSLLEPFDNKIGSGHPARLLQEGSHSPPRY